MPFIDVRISRALNSKQAERIGSGVTCAMVDILRKRREVTAVCLGQVGEAPG